MAENQGQAIKQVAAANGASASATSPFPPPPPPLLDGSARPPAAAPAARSDARPAAVGSHAGCGQLGPPAGQRRRPAPWRRARPLRLRRPRPAPSTPDGPPPTVARGSGNQVVAFSQPQGPAPLPPTPGPAYGQDAPAPPRGLMPPVQVVNKRTVKLEFDVGKFGPSGLGGVDVWVTTDDGATWESRHVDPSAMLPTSPDALNAGAGARLGDGAAEPGRRDLRLLSGGEEQGGPGQAGPDTRRAAADPRRAGRHAARGGAHQAEGRPDAARHADPDVGGEGQTPDEQPGHAGMVGPGGAGRPVERHRRRRSCRTRAAAPGSRRPTCRRASTCG